MREPRGGAAARGDEDVLVRDRHAGQRRRARRRAMRASAARACASAALRRRRDEGVERAVERCDARRGKCCVSSTLETSLRARARRDSSATRRVSCSALTRSPSARGTGRPRPPARLRWLASRWSVSVTTSSRRRSALPDRGQRRATSARRRSVSTACICSTMREDAVRAARACARCSAAPSSQPGQVGDAARRLGVEGHRRKRRVVDRMQVRKAR